MGGFFYYLGVAANSALSVFGIRAPYEQPRYAVVGHLSDQVEVRSYGARLAAETRIVQGNDGEAFGRLFRYIAGANRGGQHISMTAPVEMTSETVAMTIPVEVGGEGVMRFFLPHEVAERGAPPPTDPAVHIVTLPPQTFAALRFSGRMTAESRREHIAALLAAAHAAGRSPEGVPSVLEYDPPFALSFVRRNEVIVELEPRA